MNLSKSSNITMNVIELYISLWEMQENSLSEAILRNLKEIFKKKSR